MALKLVFTVTPTCAILETPSYGFTRILLLLSGIVRNILCQHAKTGDIMGLLILIFITYIVSDIFINGLMNFIND